MEKFTKESDTMSSDSPSRDTASSSRAYSRNKDGTADASPDRLAQDVSSLREDMTKMHDILSKFASEAGGHAARTARNVGQVVASQVGSTASGLATTGAEMASSA